MRHEHGDPSELGQPLDKPLQRAVVEVVARLIEQHGAGRVSQRASEPQAVALPDREAGERSFGVKLCIEGGDRCLESPLGVPRGEALREGQRRVVALLGGPRACGDARRSLLELGQHLARRSQRLGTHRRDRRPSRHAHLLLDQETALARARHLTSVGHKPAPEQPQQCALACAVVADHGQALPGGDGERDAVEHDAVAESFAQLARPEMQPPARMGRRQSADHL